MERGERFWTGQRIDCIVSIKLFITIFQNKLKLSQISLFSD
jgi:hypothetical protein